MNTSLATPKHLGLFKALAQFKNLLLSNGHLGASTDLVGSFKIERFGQEDRILCEDGPHHVHVRWNALAQLRYLEEGGEGLLDFLDSSDQRVMRIFNLDGPFPGEIRQFEGPLF